MAARKARNDSFEAPKSHRVLFSGLGVSADGFGKEDERRAPESYETSK
jgi:hypothetical protein